MKSIVVAGLAAAVAAAPTASGSQCAASADGKFTITTVQATAMRSKRAISPRQLDGILTMSLKDGILTDQAGRTGYIAANYQYVSMDVTINYWTTANICKDSNLMDQSKQVLLTPMASASAVMALCP